MKKTVSMMILMMSILIMPVSYVTAKQAKGSSTEFYDWQKACQALFIDCKNVLSNDDLPESNNQVKMDCQQLFFSEADEMLLERDAIEHCEVLMKKEFSMMSTFQNQNSPEGGMEQKDEQPEVEESLPETTADSAPSQE